MFQNIQTYIESFAGYLHNVINKQNNNTSNLSDFVDEAQSEFRSYGIDLTPDEALIFLIAYIPHIYPNFYDEVIKEAMPQGGDFPEFGGVRGNNHRGLLPTGETVQFILAGGNIEKRLLAQRLLTDGLLIKHAILSVESVKDGEPLMSGRIIPDQEWIHRLITGSEITPKFSPDFPAKKIITAMTWDDLVLNNYTQSQLSNIITWVEHNATLMQD
ncbi:MAG: hypothetical protein ACXVB0_17920, partial [Mucilaginibacter sp.]